MRYLINIIQRPDRIHRLILFSFSLAISLLFQAAGESQNYPKQKLSRGHFVVYHENRQFANDLNWRAEYYYKRILRHLGVQNFRPWEGKDRCVILIFKARDEYIKEMKAPEWSAGIAMKDRSLFATFEKAPQIKSQTLPHELTHLILCEYFGNPNIIPRWLNEGMAEYEEEGRDYKKRILKIVKDGTYIKLADLFDEEYTPNNLLEVGLFYDESASVIDYMRAKLMRRQFSQFLKKIKSGCSVDEVLKEVYQWKFPNGIRDFEERWIEYVTTNY